MNRVSGGLSAGRHLFLWLGAVLAMSLAASCGRGTGDEQDEAERTFAVTIHPLQAILEEMTGDRAAVVRILPPNASPHTHDPRPSDVRRAERALALFYVDPLLDGWAARLRRDRPVAVLPMIDPEVLLEEADHHHHHGDEDHEHHHHHHDHEFREGITLPDPHFWTDPMVVRSVLPSLLEQLVRYDPEGESEYRANTEAFAAGLEELDSELAEILDPVRGEKVVLFHPSFRYMLDRYGLEYAGVIEPFPGREATPRYLQELINRFEDEGIKAIFSEPQLPQRAAEVVAEGTARPVYLLDPVGGVPGRDTYVELLRYNAQVLRKALE